MINESLFDLYQYCFYANMKVRIDYLNEKLHP